MNTIKNVTKEKDCQLLQQVIPDTLCSTHRMDGVSSDSQERKHDQPMEQYRKSNLMGKERCGTNEHPVWSILDKEKYVKKFHSQAEWMYDFIKSIVSVCGNTTKDGNTVPTMQVFFDMWNEYSGETFFILDSLVNSNRE